MVIKPLPYFSLFLSGFFTQKGEVKEVLAASGIF
jgi:hypothetical protein